jgi:hypothetical protein
MSVEVMAWVLRNSPTTGGDRLVLLAIADHAANDGSNAWPSVRTIATYANLCERAAHYAIARLVRDGHLVVERNMGGTWDTPPDRRPNRYRVVIHSGVQQIAPRDANGVQSETERGATGCTQSVLDPSFLKEVSARVQEGGPEPVDKTPMPASLRKYLQERQHGRH